MSLLLCCTLKTNEHDNIQFDEMIEAYIVWNGTPVEEFKSQFSQMLGG